MNAQNIGEILDALAARFGTTGIHLWEVLVRQQYIEAIWGLMFMAITGVFGFIWMNWLKRRGDTAAADEGIELFGMIVGGIILFIFVIASVVELLTVVPGFFNPEFYALKELLPS